MADERSRTLAVLAVYGVGFLSYSLLPLLVRTWIPGHNPLGVFASTGAFCVWWYRTRWWFWFAVGSGFAALWYPLVLDPSFRAALGENRLREVGIVLLVPALLLAVILSSGSVRRYVGFGDAAKTEESS